MPFEKASGLLTDMLRVKVSKSMGERYTEAAGAAYVALQTEEADEIEKRSLPGGSGGEKMVFSADGAMVPLIHGEWAEVRTLVIGEVQSPVLKRGEWAIHSDRLSYFSRLVSSERFEHLSLSEVSRRGIENSQQVAAVMDGAEWLQGLIDYHCPTAVRILDFPHAGQRIGQISEAVWGQGSAETKQWTSKRLHQLKHQGPDELLVELHQLQEQHPTLDLLRENLAYLEKRTNQMQYPQFQQQGWPIGSGMVESGNKLVVEARLKGAGMHWKRENVDPILALRNIICSDRWEQEWPRIEQRLRHQAVDRRQTLRQKHRQAKQSIIPLDIAVLCLEPPPSKPVSEPTTTTKPATEKSGPWRPPANHPWRRFKFGRSLYLPSTPAKN